MKKLIFNLTILLSVCLVQQQDINCAAKVLSTSEISLNDQFIKLVNEHDWPKAEKMLSNGADINYQDSTGKTALMHAGINSDARIVDALLNRGANHELPDFQGRKFADYIAENTVLTGVYNEFLRTKGLTGIKEHKETKTVSESNIVPNQAISDISTSTNSSIHKITYLTDSIENEKHIREILVTKGFSEDLQKEILPYLINPNYSFLKDLISYDHDYTIRTLCVLYNGNLVTCCSDDIIRIFDMNNGACLKTLKGDISDIQSIYVLQDGNLVLASSDTIEILDINNGKSLRRLTDHISSIESICLLPNGERLASGYQDGRINIWDIETGDLLRTLEDINMPTNASVYSLCILPNGNLVSGHADNAIRIWDINTGICLRILERPYGNGHKKAVRSLCLLPNLNLASGSEDNTIKIWDTKTWNCLQTLTGHTRAVNSLCVLPNYNLVSGSWDGTIKTWDINTWNCLHTGYNVKGSFWVLPYGNLASNSWDGTIKIWSNNMLDLSN